jgi:hypothetical protein
MGGEKLQLLKGVFKEIQKFSFNKNSNIICNLFLLANSLSMTLLQALKQDMLNNFFLNSTNLIVICQIFCEPEL